MLSCSDMSYSFFFQNVKILFTNFFVVQKVKVLLQSWCDWEPRTVDSPITAIHATASLTQKPNNAYRFVGVESPSLVVDFQEGLNGGRWNVTGTILWLFGWVGVLGFVSQLPFFFFSLKKKKTATKSMSAVQPILNSCFFCR